MPRQNNSRTHWQRFTPYLVALGVVLVALLLFGYMYGVGQPGT